MRPVLTSNGNGRRSRLPAVTADAIAKVQNAFAPKLARNAARPRSRMRTPRTVLRYAARRSGTTAATTGSRLLAHLDPKQVLDVILRL